MDRMPPEMLSGEGGAIRLCEHLEPRAPTHVPTLRYAIEAAGQTVGEVRVRLGDSDDLKRHFGQIGYEVYPAYRGRGHASLACQLALTVMRDLGYGEAWITCNPENLASRRVCDKAGAKLVEIIDIPVEHVMYEHGIRQKCRYRIVL
ncbi:GNAT family N-acetyltransferase [Maricaulis salignorans]|uniref:GNAT family N-acetyltransferase n=1 Tax=Maricaulis salignorans TaxID=144026 RepID=UPI003A91A2DC